MPEINDTDAAFPHPSLWGVNIDGVKCELRGVQKGMSLRDYFAAAALTGLLADPTSSVAEEDENADAGDVQADYAAVAYQYADAMLKARERKE